MTAQLSLWDRRLWKKKPRKERDHSRLIGCRFGAWLVTGIEPKESGKNRRAICKCNCGEVRPVIICNLRRGISQGCCQRCSDKAREKEGKQILKGNDA